MSLLRALQPADAGAFIQDEEYALYLTSTPLERLVKEPEVLRVEVERVEREMQATVVTDYRSFIQASQCINSLHDHISELAASLQALSTSLAPLPRACEEFSNNTVQLYAERYVSS